MDKQKKLISVIIPCYNYGHTLEEAINSVLSQTYTKIEIIVINDGSTDSTDEVASSFASKFKNIRYLKGKNKGIVATRNQGISVAKGEYLVQLDADDFIDQDYIEKTLSVAVSKKADIAYTDVKVFGRSDKLMNFPEHNIDKLKVQNYIHASSLVRKSVFDKAQYDPNLEVVGYEDWDLFLGACLAGAKAVHVKNTKLHYRKHEVKNSRSDISSGVKRSLQARIYILEKYIKQYEKEMKDISPLLSFYKGLESEVERLSKTTTKLEEEINTTRHDVERLRKLKLIRVRNKIAGKIGRERI